MNLEDHLAELEAGNTALRTQMAALAELQALKGWVARDGWYSSKPRSRNGLTLCPPALRPQKPHPGSERALSRDDCFVGWRLTFIRPRTMPPGRRLAGSRA